MITTALPIKTTINCRGTLLDLSVPKIMGILNVTPDSFFDGGKFNQENAIIKQVELMLSEGADVIDIGAVSSRPGAIAITEKEEMGRLLPALEIIVKNFPEVIISVDTFRSGVAKKAIETGAHIINDISAGETDQNMISTIAMLKVPYILMHMQGTPESMQQNPVYQNVVKEVMDFFIKKTEQLRKQNVEDIILDPGFGFGKTTEHNFSLLKGLEIFKITGKPVMAGVSRKSMICKTLHVNPENALNGTTVVNTIALINGANILRVHDVKEAKESILIYEQYRKSALN